MTEAVTVAVRERLERLVRPEAEAHTRFEAIMALAKDCAGRPGPVIGSQGIDAFLYDPQTGLPRGD